MGQNNFLSKGFLLLLLTSVLFACFLVFKPFINEIIVAVILVTIFYTPYEFLLKRFRGHKNLASLVMCFFIVLLVVIPLVNFIIYGAQKSVVAYSETVDFINHNDVNAMIKEGVLSKFKFIDFGADSIKDLVANVAKKVSVFFYDGASKLVLGTTSFLVSILLIIIAMFFFFVDGREMLERLMYLTPLSNKDDKAIFKKFRDVSVSIVISTFVTAIAQGVLGAIGFLIVGLPAFFAGVFIAIFSLIPYVGSFFIWCPAGLYLLFTGQIWEGVFMLVWGALIVSSVDNFIKAYLIKNKAQVHPVFIIFSLLGGIALFGFWGIIFGPLIISLAVTIIHIYEKEYESVLEK